MVGFILVNEKACFRKYVLNLGGNFKGNRLLLKRYANVLQAIGYRPLRAFVILKSIKFDMQNIVLPMTNIYLFNDYDNCPNSRARKERKKRGEVKGEYGGIFKGGGEKKIIHFRNVLVNTFSSSIHMLRIVLSASS